MFQSLYWSATTMMWPSASTSLHTTYPSRLGPVPRCTPSQCVAILSNRWLLLFRIPLCAKLASGARSWLSWNDPGDRPRRHRPAGSRAGQRRRPGRPHRLPHAGKAVSCLKLVGAPARRAHNRRNCQRDREEPSKRFNIGWPSSRIISGLCVTPSKTTTCDDEVVAAIRAVLASTPFHGEGYRKVRARLAHRGLAVGGKRVLR
jgi:hypothetical protein